MEVFNGSLSHYRLQLLVPALYGDKPWTGRLTLERGPTRRTFYFEAGVLKEESSTLATEHLSQVLANLKIIDAGRSATAFQEAHRQGLWLGSFLVQRGDLNEAELLKALEHKAREAFCDCYEWESGDFQFDPSAPRPSRGLELNLNLADLHREALERRREWRSFWDIFRASDTCFQVHADRMGADATEEDEELTSLAQQGCTLSELLSRSKNGRLPAARRILALYRRGTFKTLSSQGLKAGEAASVAQLVSIAQGHFAQGDYERAARLAGQALERAAVPEAHLLFRKAESHAARAVALEVQSWEGKLKVLPMEGPTPFSLTSDDLYLHARLTSEGSVTDVVRTAPMGELAAYRSIRKLIEAGAICIEGEEDLSTHTLQYGVRLEG